MEKVTSFLASACYVKNIKRITFENVPSTLDAKLLILILTVTG